MVLKRAVRPTNHLSLITSVLVPGRGLEPLRIAPPDPKSGASANFATLASENLTRESDETKPFLGESPNKGERLPAAQNLDSEKQFVESAAAQVGLMFLQRGDIMK